MKPDVVVVGGGLVGVCVAWGLVRAGLSVTILDEGDLAFRAARGNFGLVWVQSKGMGKPAYSHWTRASATKWRVLNDELKCETGIDPGYTQPGGFSIRLTETELQRGRDFMSRFLAQPGMEPLPYEILDAAETRRRLPEAGPTVAGSIFSPLDGHANPLRLFAALHKALRQRGADYRPNHRVHTIAHRGSGFELGGDGWTLGADRVVLAAGIGISGLAPMVGLRVPLVPSRGQIIVTERARPFLHHPTGSLRQTDEGTVIIGESKEALMDHQRPRAPVTAVLADRAVRAFPLVANLNTVRIWAAFRVVTLDGFPVYQQSKTCPGAFAVACHSGVTLAANHAYAIPEQIAAGAFADTLTPFSSDRFDVPAAA